MSDFSIGAINGHNKKSIDEGVGCGYVALNNNNNDEEQKKKIDIFDQNASVASCGQGSVWTMS